MAIDTEARRRSVQAYTLGLMRPPADSSITESDRATVAWLYAGLDYGQPPVAVGRMRQIMGLVFSRGRA